MGIEGDGRVVSIALERAIKVARVLESVAISLHRIGFMLSIAIGGARQPAGPGERMRYVTEGAGR
ncbi:hypothetical protein GCM10010399_48230 [Dactylosporangium fulvum]|uniref:Uncharacterized protein n=1 Tax=Dactylosporangium fulvum TaxID=53359 RepID=A0ABY5VS32_9ACTN|nr:hypothetical protein [Dactylosporangium fulvum]UWP80558.1 hypothetical protein Dfulv_36130 [Dactylosporangium fulvum]